MNDPVKPLTDAEILAARPPKNAVDLRRPYAFFVEPERTAAGRIEEVATIFLTNRECPFRCLFCDLWKNTTDQPVPPGAIPEQIDYALARLPPARHLKLYNSGNFFDAQAIPAADHQSIADRVRIFETVIVENHPRLCSAGCLRFRDRIGTSLEIALGLETVHPEILRTLNKQMTVTDFDRAAQYLVQNGISVRAFVLLRPPLLSEEEGIEWAIRSIDHAFSVGATCCSVIPVRAGNGIMERLQQEGRFTPPRLRSLETLLETGIRLGQGRVFVDLWEAERLHDCPDCGPRRIKRLHEMNLTQTISPRPSCVCEKESNTASM
jgi:archaeosine synthase beta-subunit